MNPKSFHTLDLRDLLGQIEAGQKEARNELLRRVGARLEHLTRKMLRRYPAVARWENTDDVFQNAVVRLLRALEQVNPGDTRSFFNLAAVQIRRELIDLARHYQGPQGHGRHHHSWPESAGSTRSNQRSEERPDPETLLDQELEAWTSIHETVEKLPVREREVFSLRFYHQWTHGQVADLLQIDESTARRLWKAACQQLGKELQGRIGDLLG